MLSSISAGVMKNQMTSTAKTGLSSPKVPNGTMYLKTQQVSELCASNQATATPVVTLMSAWIKLISVVINKSVKTMTEATPASVRMGSTNFQMVLVWIVMNVIRKLLTVQ